MKIKKGLFRESSLENILTSQLNFSVTKNMQKMVFPHQKGRLIEEDLVVVEMKDLAEGRMNLLKENAIYFKITS